jgi:hypothetical protein
MTSQKTFQTISTEGMQVLRNNYIIIIAILFVVCSCGKHGPTTYEISSQAEAGAFLDNENETNIYETKLKEVNFKLSYMSSEAMAIRELGDLSKATQASFDTLVKSYDSLMFFDLEISIDHFNEEMIHYGPVLRDEASFENRVAYYSFGMQKDICLTIAGKDTVPCTVYHYERNYGVSPQNHFMLGFRASRVKDAVLVYHNQLLATGPVKFALKEQDLLYHPKIKIN